LIEVQSRFTYCRHLSAVSQKLQKGWAFRVGTWNIDSLTGRSGELVEALVERRMDVACVQEIWWRGSGCRFFGAIGKRYKLFWMGSKAKTDGCSDICSREMGRQCC